MKKKTAGFTLIELLVVVLIIGILAAVALPQYEKAVEKSRVAEANLILKSLADACSRYYLANPDGGCFWDTIDISLNLPEADFGPGNVANARQGKYFWYSLETSGDEIFGCRGNFDQEEDWDYCLYFTYGKNPGEVLTRSCQGRNERGRKICASVCGRTPGGDGTCIY